MADNPSIFGSDPRIPDSDQPKERYPGELKVEGRVSIEGVEDIVEARQKGRTLAQELGFSMTQSTLIATAISELARNIVLYAQHGEVVLARKINDSHIGIVISAVDYGPGIANVEHALMSGYSSSGGLGLGLPGVRQMMDEFKIQSEPGAGTRVTTTMWLG